MVYTFLALECGAFRLFLQGLLHRTGIAAD